MFNVSIPEISDEQLKELYEQIKPVITVKGKLHYFREFTFDELKWISYIQNLDEDVREEVGENKLEVLENRDFVCLHNYGDRKLFKPRIFEVLSQIDRHVVFRVKAFEIIESPQTADDFFKDSFRSIAFYNGYHVSTVRLYGEKW